MLDVERDYRRYYSIVHGEEGLPADVPADVVQNLDDIFA